MKIAVIGAGNGGQSIAGYLSMKGYSVSLYDIDKVKIDKLKIKDGIELTGCIHGIGKVGCYTTDIKEAVEDFSVAVTYDHIKEKGYVLSAGQYFDIKIEYDIILVAVVI